ncbi:Calponin-3 [Cichlidogyrus casuarinus]|uniref:Calponin n=1 Tax=Cichlidogyrus casuarinus TaxID=1844966 RepID=A0ABD2Q8Q8_9PLAT
MASRGTDMGDMAAINRKDSEAEVLDWINKLTGVNIPAGRENVQASLKNGQTLVKLVEISFSIFFHRLIDAVYQGTPNLPGPAKKYKLPFKANTMSAPFKQMENIQVFLNATQDYGVPNGNTFQTVDLFEGRNMPQVLNALLQLGSECQRHGFNGATCGPKPTYENKRNFTDEQLRASEGIIGLQAGTNKGASQSGMSMGGVRHIADIKVDNMSKEGQSIIGLQAGSNKGASQSGMNMGGIRHIADMKVEAMNKDSEGIIGLQAGSNKGASQSGMSFGGQRHVADIKVDPSTANGTIGLQMGYTEGASQSGMSFGAQRHITDSH